MFVWVEVFAWLVGLLYACGVRRIKDLLRVCPSFCPIRSYLSLYLPFSFSLCIAFCLWLFFALVVFACPLVLSLLFLFPLRTTRKKKGRSVLVRPLSSCCELLYLRIAAAFLSAIAAALWHS